MKKIFVMTIMTLLLLSSVMAYTVEWTLNGNLPFKGSSYECGASCDKSDLTHYETQAGSSDITLTFSGPTYDEYLVYLYPQDACHVPTKTYLYLDTTWSWTQDIVFTKQDASFCGSNVDNIYVTNTNPSIGETVTVSADLQSAWSFGDHNFAPDALADYYDSFVNVTFYVNGISEEKEFIRIPWGQWESVDYDFTPGAPGDYVLRIETTMDDDCKCEGSNTKYQEVIIHVGDNDIPEFTSLGLVTILGLVAVFVVSRLRD